MTTLYIVFAGLWGGIWWRLRGGALTALTGFNPGTGGDRAICAVGMSSLLVLFVSWHWAFLIPVLWGTWSASGWGAFQSMGTSPIEMKNPVARTLARLGVTCPLWNDLAGMAIVGVFVTTCISVIPEWITRSWHVGLAIPFAGLAFSPLYFVAQRGPWRPDLGRFARAGSEWGEFLVGFWVASVVVAAVLLL